MTEIILVYLKELFSFIKNPNCIKYQDKDLRFKTNFFIIILVLSLVINLIFAMILYFLEELGVFNIEDHAFSKILDEYSSLQIIILAVVAAPFIEELIFRAPITLFCKYTNTFKYTFYGFTLAFGFIHLTNFELTRNVLIASPILVAPQIILGLFLGFIRVRMGLLHSILFHAVYNGIIIIPGLLFTTP